MQILHVREYLMCPIQLVIDDGQLGHSPAIYIGAQGAPNNIAFEQRVRGSQINVTRAPYLDEVRYCSRVKPR